jgi:hypothetical protein
LINKSKNLGELYKYIKKTNSSQKIDTFIDIDGSVISEPKEILYKFSNYFASNFNNRENDFSESDLNTQSLSLPDIEISMNDIFNALKKFNFNKAQGLTFLSNYVIKHCLNG